MTTNIKPTVSVCIITYNHAHNIRRCIEGALMQKTTFPFEIVIGEDCSTDGTREIIMDYSNCYPDIIRVITSGANVGAGENYKRTNHACRGEFIAYCEGDDYWIDPLKLQKQYETIRKYNSVLITHSTLVCSYINGKLSGEIYFRKAMDESGFLDVKDIITLESHFHTSSFFINAHFINNLPEWISQSPVGDYPVKVISAHLGGIYYINEFMSVYQKNTPGSFTNRKRESKIQNEAWISDHEKELVIMYKNLDQFTEYKYSDVIKLHIRDRYTSYYQKNGNLDFLELSGFNKYMIKQIAFLIRPFPTNLRNKISYKIVSHYFHKMKTLKQS